jgi:hypothetical protein
MSTISESTTLSQTVSQALTETDAECPLHIAMREMARLAVTQHVLYLEGECLPRPDVTRQLEIWSSLHALVSTRLCATARTTPLDREDFAIALEAIRARVECSDTAGRFSQDLEEVLTRSASCASSTSCPLGDLGNHERTRQSSPRCVVPRPNAEDRHTRADAAGESQHEK